MEANVRDIDHLDSDVCLPPRKRLLAWLKRQNCDSTTSKEIDSRINKLLNSHLNGSPLSFEDTLEASRTAAIAAVKLAEDKRAIAEEKAAVSAKAVAAAKRALDLVASVSEEEAFKRERQMSKKKKNKLKKHVQVQHLYKKNVPTEQDEELARNLHRAINSSPRISKTCSSSQPKSRNKQKKLKCSSNNGGFIWEENQNSKSNSMSSSDDKVDSDGSFMEINSIEFNEKAPICSMEYSAEKTSEAFLDNKMRGKVKQKKLPLSICTVKDRETPKNMQYRSHQSGETKRNPNKANKSPLVVRVPLRPVDATPVRTCQELKPPECVKQNKFVQF